MVVDVLRVVRGVPCPWAVVDALVPPLVLECPVQEARGADGGHPTRPGKEATECQGGAKVEVLAHATMNVRADPQDVPEVTRVGEAAGREVPLHPLPHGHPEAGRGEGGERVTSGEGEGEVLFCLSLCRWNFFALHHPPSLPLHPPFLISSPSTPPPPSHRAAVRMRDDPGTRSRRGEGHGAGGMLSRTAGTAPARREVLVLQSSNDEYAPLLHATRSRNAAYARRHNYTYYHTTSPVHTLDPHGHMSKVLLLNQHLDGPYRHILYLDADAVVVDPSRRVEDEVPWRGGVGLHFCQGGRPTFRWNVNAGVLLIDTRNAGARGVVRQWRHQCLFVLHVAHVMGWHGWISDQTQLHIVLAMTPTSVYTSHRWPHQCTFNYNGSFVSHSLRSCTDNRSHRLTTLRTGGVGLECSPYGRVGHARHAKWVTRLFFLE